MIISSTIIATEMEPEFDQFTGNIRGKNMLNDIIRVYSSKVDCKFLKIA